MAVSVKVVVVDMEEVVRVAIEPEDNKTLTVVMDPFMVDINNSDAGKDVVHFGLMAIRCDPTGSYVINKYHSINDNSLVT